MDEQKLERYLNDKTEIKPPYINERKIHEVLAARQKRRILIVLSVAALLWVMVFHLAAVWVYRINQSAAYILAGCFAIGLMTSGIFSGLVLKYKKEGV